MVVALARGMSRHDGRDVVMLCEECHSKMLAVGELLLLSCEARPIFTTTFDLHLSKETFVHYRDKVIDKLNHILIASRDVSSQVHAGNIHWKSMTPRIQEVGSLVTGLTELSAHIAYIMAVNCPESYASQLGVVNKYKLHQAKLDLKFCCSRLKRSCVDDLDPHLLVDLCSTMSRALSGMTEVCRQGAEKAGDVEDQNQFKLCIKSVTSTTSCLIASVKRFKSSPSIDHLRRIIAFCDPVVSTSGALVTFASEEEFVGQVAKLSDKATEVHKSVLGMTMSIVSASIQMCKAIRDLVYDLSNTRHRQRIRLCMDSTDKASSKLRDLLLSCDFEPKTSVRDPDSAQSQALNADSADSKVASGISRTCSADAKLGSLDGKYASNQTSDRKSASNPSSLDGKSASNPSSLDEKNASSNPSSIDGKTASSNPSSLDGKSVSNPKARSKESKTEEETKRRSSERESDSSDLKNSSEEAAALSTDVADSSKASVSGSADPNWGASRPDGLDLNSGSTDTEGSDLSTGLSGSSPLLSLSTSTLGSISDVDTEFGGF